MKFTIRDVAWLTVVVALCFSWWRDHVRLIQSRDEEHIAYERARRAEQENLSVPLPSLNGRPAWNSVELIHRLKEEIALLRQANLEKAH